MKYFILLTFLFSFKSFAVYKFDNHINPILTTINFSCGTNSTSSCNFPPTSSIASNGIPCEFTKVVSAYFHSANAQIRLEYQCQHYKATETIRGGGHSGCASDVERFDYANSICASQGLQVAFEETKAMPYESCDHACEPYFDPIAECEQFVADSCVANGGIADFNYTDLGNGQTQCTGSCNDGSQVDDEPKSECNFDNNYCDVPDDPSNIDVGSGGSGFTNPSNTTLDPKDDYVSNNPTDTLTNVSLEPVVNEIRDFRNDYVSLSAEQSKNQIDAIIAKSDDISNAVGNVGNAVVDAINGQTPFYDGNIVDELRRNTDAINGLGTGGSGDNSDIVEAIEGIGSGYNGGSYTRPSNFDDLFINPDEYDTHIEQMKLELDTKIVDFKAALNSTISVNPSSVSYQPETLNLSYGTFDISLSRFFDASDYSFIRSILMFLAALLSLWIVLGGVRW